MHIRELKPSELSSDHLDRWRALQAADPALASPYFAPEFTLAVGCVRSDARAAVFEDADGIAAFLPMQRRLSGSGRPIGGTLSDYQAIVARRDWDWQPQAALAALDLPAFDFDHALAAQPAFASHARRHDVSRVIDIAAGLESYMAARKKASDRFARSIRKQRALEREVGTIEFVLQDARPVAFETLIAWKRAQYKRTGTVDVLGQRWAVDLLRRLAVAEGPDFKGLLSSLSAGGKIVALQFGMRYRNVWHLSFPAYDMHLAKHSPGSALLLAQLAAAPGLGVDRIDLGAGGEDYKTAFANAEVAIVEGAIERPGLVTTLRRIRRGTIAGAARLPIGQLATWPDRLDRRIRRRLEIR